jgi:hypothetical protein
MNSSKHIYQVREYIGNKYSKQIGCRLRIRTDALRIVRILKKQGRSVFATKAS